MQISTLVNRLTILPRWIIVVIDLLVVVFATSLGYLFRFNFNMEEIARFRPAEGIGLLVVTGLVATVATRSYKGIVRYTGVEDGIRIMYASLLSIGLAGCVNLLYFYNEGKNLIPYSVLLISFFTSFLSRERSIGRPTSQSWALAHWGWSPGT
jgi:FlaA1/EpsC-like NDP-sugar epimerase